VLVGSETSAGGQAAATPTRGVLILPGLGNNAGDYAELAAHLQASRSPGEVAVAVAPIGRADWGRNAAALADPSWWRGQLRPRPAVDWYLTRVDAAMQVDAALCG
jgi:NAD(P)H-hydrate repair Nnr-like enzyme with NAD(P)H-hydrate epimerase domain